MDRLDQLSKLISATVAQRKKVIIPTFVDDSFYAILYYLRVTKAFSMPFWIASFAYTPLMNAMLSVSGSDNAIPISSAEALQLEQRRLVGLSLMNSVIFAPYPIGAPEFGQIIELKRKYVDALTHVQAIYGDAAGAIPVGVLSSGASKLRRFVQELQVADVFGPAELQLDGCLPYPARRQVSDSVVRWIDLGARRRLQRAFDLDLIAGKLEGERALPRPVERQYVMNPPQVEELARLLRQEGASHLRLNGRTVSCRFTFVGGNDCEASIELGDVITITTGSARIENVLLGLIGTVVAYPL
jgi:hypothetical protein